MVKVNEKTNYFVNFLLENVEVVVVKLIERKIKEKEEVY